MPFVALASLEQASGVRDQRLVFLKDDPRWYGRRKAPRSIALLKQFKLDRFGPGLTPS